MNQELTQATASDRLGLPDLHEISDLLLRSGLFCFRVASWSMYPAVWKGDQLTVEPASPTSLQAGDVILFHQCGQLICHRVVALDTAGPGTRVITKGDAATGCGEVIRPDQVLGRVVTVTRRWPWSRSGLWVGALARRVDQATERLTLLLVQWLQSIQTVRSYRWIMRALLSRCVAYYVGIPEGKRWFRYQRISGWRPPGPLVGHHRYHLVAKLAGIWVGSVRVTASGEGYRIDDFYVRLRYRGLGVGSHLLAVAATAASRSRPSVLLASIEPANTAALRLFTKAGFRHTGGLRGNQVSLRREL